MKVKPKKHGIIKTRKIRMVAIDYKKSVYINYLFKNSEHPMNVSADLKNPH